MEKEEKKMKVIFREGKRIYLRPLEKGDAEICQVWFNDPEIQDYLLQSRPVSLEEELKYLAGLSERDREISLMIVNKNDDKAIGSIGLNCLNTEHRKAELGIAIGDKDFWSKGYGSEAIGIMLKYAFDTLNLHRVGLCVLMENPRAYMCYKKCGFSVEGSSRESVFRKGEYQDVIEMAILESEYRR